MEAIAGTFEEHLLRDAERMAAAKDDPRGFLRAYWIMEASVNLIQEAKRRINPDIGKLLTHGAQGAQLFSLLGELLKLLFNRAPQQQDPNDGSNDGTAQGLQELARGGPNTHRRSSMCPCKGLRGIPNVVLVA